MQRQTIKRGGTRKTAHKNMTNKIKEICNKISNNYRTTFYAVENLCNEKWVYVIIYAEDKGLYYAGWNRIDHIDRYDFHHYMGYREAVTAIFSHKINI